MNNDKIKSFFSSAQYAAIKNELGGIASVFHSQALSLNEVKRIKDESNNNTWGKFTFQQLPKGSATTLSVGLRRQLISEMEGYRFVAMKIENIKHQYTTISGIREEVLYIKMNLKKVSIRCNWENPTESCIYFSLPLEKTGDIYAGDILCPEGYSISNPYQFICYVNAPLKIKIDLFAIRGVGYKKEEDYEAARVNELSSYSDQSESYILMDTYFNPVTRVVCEPNPASISSNPNYDVLSVTIDTDGSTSPEKALNYAVERLVRIYASLSSQELLNAKTLDDMGTSPFNPAVFKNLNELGLTPRVKNTILNLVGADYRAEKRKQQSLMEESTKYSIGFGETSRIPGIGLKENQDHDYEYRDDLEYTQQSGSHESDMRISYYGKGNSVDEWGEIKFISVLTYSKNQIKQEKGTGDVTMGELEKVMKRLRVSYKQPFLSVIPNLKEITVESVRRTLVQKGIPTFHIEEIIRLFIERKKENQ